MMIAMLRPLGLGELLDQTFTLYRRHFWVFVGIMALPQLFMLAVGLSMEALQASTSPQQAGGDPQAAASAAFGIGIFFLVGMLVMLVAFYATYVLALAATVFAVSDVYLGRPTSVRAAYGRVRGKVWRLLDVLISTGLRIVFGFMLLIIPGVVLLIRYALAIPAAVLEDLKANAAMKRSAELAKGRYGRIFVVLLLFMILSWVAALLLQFPFQIAQAIYLQRGEMVPWLGILANVGGFLAGLLVGPLMTIALALVYYDQRVRREAFDLQVMMAELDRKPSGLPLPTSPVSRQ